MKLILIDDDGNLIEQWDVNSDDVTAIRIAVENHIPVWEIDEIDE